MTPAFKSTLNTWASQGVNFDTVTTPLIVNWTYVYTSPPTWVLDAANGKIAEDYLKNCGINLTTFPGAYRFKVPDSLNCCDDMYTMPHAAPTWATHGSLWGWNKTCRGAIWVGCSAGATLANSINPADSSQQMNFLVSRNPRRAPTPWPDNSLRLNHADGSLPYSYRYADDPVAQFIGDMGAAQQGGSEQIYVPMQSTDPGGATRWNPLAKIIVFDSTHADITAPNFTNGNVAASLVYGRGFDSANRGYVVMTGAHDLAGNGSANIAAQRSFTNFAFFQAMDKVPVITVTGLKSGQRFIPFCPVGLEANVSTFNTSGNGNPRVASYQWSSSCGGTFSHPDSAKSTFAAPNLPANTRCILSLEVVDSCGRKSFAVFNIFIAPPPSPDTLYPPKPICPTCPTTATAVNDDIDTSLVGTVSSFFCSTPPNYTLAGLTPGGKFTAIPNGFVKDTAKICIKTCLGCCDTSYVFLPPPTPTPDTIITPRPVCTTCPVPVCAVNDDVDTTGATSTSFCGTPANYTITGPSTAGCITATPNGMVKDTA